jgi:hypothetical protein
MLGRGGFFRVKSVHSIVIVVPRQTISSIVQKVSSSPQGVVSKWARLGTIPQD